MKHKNPIAALLILGMLFGALPVRASSWNPALLVNTETFQIIDDSDTAADIYVRFGDSLNKRLTFERTLDRFNFNDDVYISGNITASGTASGKIVHAQDTLSSSGTVVWEGAASGASLWVSTFKGAGLVTSCNGDTETLGWNATTQRFECGDDDTGGGSSNSAGQGLTLSNSVFSLSSSFSGSIIRAQDSLASSGTLVVKKRAGTSTGNILTIDTKGLVYDATNKRVGIGTAAPGARLDIIRTGNTGNQFRTSDSEGETAAVRTYSTADGGGLILNQYYAVAGSPYLRNADFVASMSDVSATQMRFFTKNSSADPALAMLIDKAGNVGIGTTSPDTKFQVSGTNNTHGIAIEELATDGTRGTYLDFINANNGGTDTAGSMRFYANTTNQVAGIKSVTGATGATGDLSFWTNSSGGASDVAERVRIAVNGNVGIGTASPYSRAQISAATFADSMTLGSPTAVGLTVSNNNPAYGLNIGVSETGPAWIQSGRVDGTATAYNLSLQAAGGNVGIGTAGPATLLELNTATAASSAVTGAKARISGNGNTGYSAAELQLYDRSADHNWNIRMEDANDGAAFKISKGTFGANTSDYLTIDNAGNVGIGTTAPTETLEIIGTASGRKLFANDALASSGTIAVRSMAKAGSGAFTAIAAEYQTGAYIFGSGASVLALESYTNHKDGSRALAPSILFGYKGVFDTNLYRASGSTLRSDGQFLLTSTDAFNRPVFKIDTAETTGTQNIVEMYSDVTSTQNRVFRFRADGQAYADGSWNSGGADLAEWFATADTGMRPGDLACLDPKRPLHVKRCNNMKQRIVGIVSTKPGFVGGQEETFLLAGKIPVLVGLLGQIPVKVVGPVEIGDIIGLSGTVDGVGAALHEARQSACMALESFSGEGIGVVICLAPSPQVWSATLDSE